MTLYVAAVESVLSSDFTNPVVNVFTYDVDDIIPSSVTASDFADEFYTAILSGASGMVGLLNNQMALTRIVVTAPQVPTVLAIKTLTDVGLRTGTASARWNAVEFKSERTLATIRAGFKRFGVLSQTDIAGSNITSGFLAVCDAFASVMSDTVIFLSGGSTFNARPIIVKRVKYVAPSGNDAYRLPQAGDPYSFSYADNWSFLRLTTQNSRKS